MILATLDDASRFSPLHTHFPAGFEFLRSLEAGQMPDGRIDLGNDDLFAIGWSGTGKGQSGAVLECHRNYIDIQYVVSGVDVVGWRPLDACERVKQAYDAESDLAFFFDQPEAWCRVRSGSLVILYPEDVHAPLGGTTPLQKVVVKVPL